MVSFGAEFDMGLTMQQCSLAQYLLFQAICKCDLLLLALLDSVDTLTLQLQL